MDEPKPKPSDVADDELLRTYQQTTGGVHDMVANALVAEIARRNLNI